MTLSPKRDSLVVVMFPIHNMYYPRNSRIRAFLDSHSYEVTAINRGTTTHSSNLGKVRGVLALFRSSLQADVVILSEMSLKYATLTYLASRVNNATHVVDGFIGLYETDVEDKKKYSPTSLRAWILRKLDSLALGTADVYLTDTDVRANALKLRARTVTDVISLPVGAPAWATPEEHLSVDRCAQPGGERKILYYGNYIPLHGLELFVDAWARVGDPGAIRTIFIGGGDCYNDVYNKVHDLGLAQYCTFLPSVPEAELKGYISAADVVLGIFGDSDKARTVIANKVWQGLACGRPVLTGASKALDEIASVAGSSLISVERNVVAISEALTRIVNGSPHEPDVEIADKLERYVDSKFGRFEDALRTRVVSKRNRSSV